jgi:hypothetical protein
MILKREDGLNLKVASELTEDIKEESRHLTNRSARRARQDIDSCKLFI